MRQTIAILLALSVTTPAFAAGLPAAQFQDLAGTWHCDGVFPASGKTLSSNLRIEWNAASGTIVKHHDDTAEAGYHAVELWAAMPDGTLRNTIADPFSGVRAFTSSGWQGDTLTWQGAASAARTERFVYKRLDGTTLQIDWDVSKDGEAYKTGDTLTCKRTG